jgi:hypothetical protein
VPPINRNALPTPTLDKMCKLYRSPARQLGLNDNNDTYSKMRTRQHADLQASPMVALFGLCTTFAARTRLFDRTLRQVVHSDEVEWQSSNLPRHMQWNKD